MGATNQINNTNGIMSSSLVPRPSSAGLPTARELQTERRRLCARSSGLHHHNASVRCQVPCNPPGDVSGAAGISRRHALALPSLLGALEIPGAAGAFALEPGTSAVPLTGGSAPFPLASFGLYVYDDDTARKLTLTALEVGYRNFFSSVLATNQRGFAAGVKQSSVPRSEVYICGSVLSNNARGYNAAYKLSAQGCADNMKAMRSGGIEYLDMIMLDYPGPDADSIRGQWAALEQMKADGLVKDLAVSNFSPAQLDIVLETGGSPIAVNQLPFSLANRMTGVVEANRARGVLVQSWSPLRRLTKPQLKVCGDVGSAHGKSAQQVALRWIVQRGAAFTFSSRTKSHFEENLDVFSWELTDEEMAYINKYA